MSFTYSVNQTDINTGHKNLADIKETAPARLVLTPKGASLATKTAALLQSGWTTNFKAARPTRWYPLPLADMVAIKDEEDKPTERPFKGGYLTTPGDKGFTMDFITNPYLTKMLANLDTSNLGAYVIDQNDNIKGKSSDGTKFESRPISSFNVTHPTPAPGEPQVTRIEVMFSDQISYIKTYEVINPAEQSGTKWSPKEDFDGVYYVDLAIVGTWTATGGQLRVTYAHNGLPVTGLQVADFAISGKTITGAAAVAGDGGTYQIVSSTLVTSSIDLVACASITLTTIKIESSGSASFTIA